MFDSFLRTPSKLVAVVAGLWQWLATSLFCLFVLENEAVARAFVSGSTWQWLLAISGGQLQQTPDGTLATASLGGIAATTALVCLFVNLGAVLVGRIRGAQQTCEFAARKCVTNALWTWPLGLWCLGWIFTLTSTAGGLATLLLLTVRMAAAVTLASWLFEIVRECSLATAAMSPTISGKRPLEQASSQQPSARAAAPAWWFVGLGMLIYVVIFVSMNWGLWYSLQLPHGDSSMYEEHLWNTLHGKGFRSYLDQGLFLGEHIQVIHLLLLPLYAIWPSHLLLELSESTALALGAIPVFQIARRHGRSDRAALFLALAYLLYFPMHYLDISIDLKTFRPSAFGIPFLFWMIDAAERRRWGRMTLWLLLSLACQEDFGVVIAPFGVWLCCEGWWRLRHDSTASQRGQLIAGGIITILVPLYVVLAVKVLIPAFHGGATVHYASYFQAFGTTPVEIVTNILTRPSLLGKHLFTAASVALFLDLLMPLGMPLRAWRRLLVGLPLFVLLCLNELTRDFPGPFHHFHAALIPVLLWAAAAALNTSSSSSPTEDMSARQLAERRGLWMLCCALTTSVFFSMSPIGISFWDAGGPFYWRRLYIPGERAREFAKIPPLIPHSARVASTDFVHPRFTHYARSYDYSHYPRRVADYQDKVPDDTDYIVIDTTHRYSEIHRYEETREYRNQRDQWEVVPVDTHGMFIVLKRIKYPSPKTASP